MPRSPMTRMPRASLVVGFLSSVGLLMAQPALTGPVEGYTFDVPARSLRAVIGSLGSASLGPALVRGLDYGSVAPRQDYALAFEGGRCRLVSGLRFSQASTVEIPGSFPVPDGIVWSGNGSVAVLYSRTNHWIQTLRGLPDAVQAGPWLSLSPLAGRLSAVATDFKGEHTAIAVTGDTSGVFQLAGDLSFVPLLQFSNPAALAFSDDGSTLYALDDAGALSELNMADLTSQAWPSSGLENAFFVKPARDAAQRSVVYVAGGSDRLLVVYDRSSREIIARVPLNSEPTTIETFGRNSFLLGPRATDG